MAIKYTNLDFGDAGLRNLITASFDASIVTESAHSTNKRVGVRRQGISANTGSIYLYNGTGFYQSNPSLSLNISDRLLPIQAGDIITWDIGEFGTLGGSITRKIESVLSASSGGNFDYTIFKLDEALDTPYAYNSASWVINRRIEDENYIVFELPYEYFNISTTSSTKQIINGFLVPENYNPDLIYRLDEIAGKAGLGPMTVTSTGSSNPGGFGGGRFGGG